VPPSWLPAVFVGVVTAVLHQMAFHIAVTLLAGLGMAHLYDPPGPQESLLENTVRILALPLVEPIWGRKVPSFLGDALIVLNSVVWGLVPALLVLRFWGRRKPPTTRAADAGR
jgi:hypothetical protein